MDIAEVSMALSQMNTMSSVGTAVLSQSLDMSKTVGNEIVKMIDASAMERSVNPAVGGNIDIRL